jgi:orotidine-5'-phosphate decarboxylase
MGLAAEHLIIALDDMREEKMLEIIAATRPFATTYKIGLSLFVAHGPKIFQGVHAHGGDLFLDLKLHDIPMQVSKAVENALSHCPRFLTVHALSGRATLKEIARVAQGSTTKILAVTMLTSLNETDAQELGFGSTLFEQVLRLADLAHSCGIDGFVTSAQELAMIRRHFGKDVYLVCPGIRSHEEATHDQARTLSAYDAMHRGADALVIGRPITQAENSLLIAANIHKEIERAIKENMNGREVSL